MNVTLRDDLLQHGYRMAFAWWCIDRAMKAVRGTVINYEHWVKASLPMEWSEAVELLPALVQVNRIQGFDLLSQSAVSITLIDDDIENGWKVSRSVVINLKQHGLTEKQVKNLAQTYMQTFAANSWKDSSFLSWALKRHYHADGGDKPVLIDRHWTPSNVAVNQLISEGVPEEYIVDCVPEFRLYWQEVGIPRASYHQTFISYVQKIFTDRSFEEIGVAEWLPSEHSVSVVSKFGDDNQSAELIASFRLYWQDVGARFSPGKWEQLFIEYSCRRGPDRTERILSG